MEQHGTVKNIVAVPLGLDAGQQQALEALLPAEIAESQRREVIGRMDHSEYLLIVEKDS